MPFATAFTFLLALALAFVPSFLPATAFANSNEGIEDCSNLDTRPLPPPGNPDGAGFWAEFSRPLDPTAAWNPPGPKRVGLQAGHWRVEDAPDEIRGLSAGTFGGGKAEWEVNLDVAERTAAVLRASGVEV